MQHQIQIAAQKSKVLENFMGYFNSVAGDSGGAVFRKTILEKILLC